MEVEYTGEGIRRGKQKGKSGGMTNRSCLNKRGSTNSACFRFSLPLSIKKEAITIQKAASLRLLTGIAFFYK